MSTTLNTRHDETIEALCAAADCANVSDARSLGRLVREFEVAQTVCSRTGKETAAALCKACIHRMEALMADTLEDAPEALRQICAITSLLQHHLRTGEPLCSPVSAPIQRRRLLEAVSIRN